jgi:phosphate transport system substrate-binding protein
MRKIAAVCFSLMMSAPLAAGSGSIRYTGSSTIGKFIADAAPVYGESVIEIATRTESEGGERCVIQGTCDIGGVAREVNPEVLSQGVVATLIGRDALAVVVNESNPVRGIDSDTLARIFTGQIDNWSEIGGDKIVIRPYVVAPSSATHGVFRNIILAGQGYASVEIVQPDALMVSTVARKPGAIGQISFSFLKYAPQVRPLSIDGQDASVENPDYPIARPLYLLTPGEPKGAVREFIDWVLGPVGQAILRGRFVGAN